MYTVISYYTKNTPYENIVLNLIKSLKQFNLPHKIYPKPNQGSWVKNTQQKSVVIQEALNEFFTDIIWTDADSVIMREPVFFNEIQDKDFDVSLCYLSTTYDPHELLSGTIYFKNNQIVKNLVNDWVELNKTKTEWDQKTLQELIDGKYKDLRIVPLPPEYIKIDRFERFQKVDKPHVVYHWQASRQHRNAKW